MGREKIIMNSLAITVGGEMEPMYEREQTESFRNNVVARRLANRERQRRYRERKRMEADKRKKTTPDNHSQQRNTIIINDSSTKKCTRDWKKDARNVAVLNTVVNTPSRRRWKDEARNKTNS
ncbi:uncharacterized protein LOC124930488 [Impatiens glandulifera]|uniref:uncharacterized protein LOC124930488 n=1 Tax=Impatiens glandulifera TaxID=253017 RepID=UPI001FB14FD1|nr:uncharacterized protein LOC124930488 [Impatiens glandulifera]